MEVADIYIECDGACFMIVCRANKTRPTCQEVFPCLRGKACIWSLVFWQYLSAFSSIRGRDHDIYNNEIHIWGFAWIQCGTIKRTFGLNTGSFRRLSHGTREHHQTVYVHQNHTRFRQRYDKTKNGWKRIEDDQAIFYFSHMYGVNDCCLDFHNLC